jgi:hypothetical protein
LLRSSGKLNAYVFAMKQFEYFLAPLQGENFISGAVQISSLRILAVTV